MFMTFEVLDVADGNATMQHTLDRVKMKMDNPAMGSIEFDSADKNASDGMFAQMFDIIGTTMKITVDSRGKTSKVEMSPEMEKAMGSGRSNINVEQMLSQFMAELPEEPVAVGASWQTTMQQAMGNMGKINLTVDNTLLSLDGNDAKIGQVIKMEEDESGDDTAVDATVKSAKGELSLDLGTGLPKEAKMAMEMDIVAEQGGMEVQVAMKMNVEMRRTAAPLVTSEQGGEKDEKKDKQDK